MAVAFAINWAVVNYLPNSWHGGFAGWAFFSVFNIYEYFPALVLLMIYLILRQRGQLESVCFLAVVSACCALLQSSVVKSLFHILGSLLDPFGLLRTMMDQAGAYGPGGPGWAIQLVWALIAVVTGHVAIHRIKKAENPLRGRFLARLGLFFGYYRILVFAVVFWGFRTMH